MLASIDTLKEILIPKETKIISFDVFDTLLIRKTDPPERTKQFACRIAVERQLVDTSASVLLAARNKIENRIRNVNGELGYDLEVSVPDVFSELSRELVGDTSLTNELLDVEYETESLLILPMPGMRDFIQSLAGRFRIVAISDTYLPAIIVKRLLDAAGYRDMFETIYCSCDHLLNKGSGRLFTRVLENMGAMPNTMLHIGDNFVSDYFVPRSQGITATLLFDQWNLLRRSKLRNMALRENHSGYWFGISVHTSLSECKRGIGKNINNNMDVWGKQIVAPLLSGFIHKLVDMVREKSVKNIYFLAREGFLLKKLFEVLWRSLYSDEPPCLTYLCISRFTAFIASVRDIGDREMALALLGVQTLKHFFGRFGLTETPSLIKLLEEYDLRISDCCTDIQIIEKLKLLCADERFRSLVFARAKAMRKVLRSYLEGQGVYSGFETIMLVDVGWLGTIQDCLEHAFKEDDAFPVLDGVYIGLSSPVFPVANNKIGLIYDYRNSLPEEMAISLFRESLEFSCRSLHGTTLGYSRKAGDKILPVFSIDSTNINARKYIVSGILDIQKGVMEYIAEYASMIKLYGISSDVMARFAVQNYDLKTSFPKPELINALILMENSDDFGSSENRKILSSLSLKSILNPKGTLKCFLDTPWREATLAKSKIPFINDAYFALKRLICWKRIMSIAEKVK